MNKKLYLVIITIITVFCIIFGSLYHLSGWFFNGPLVEWIVNDEYRIESDRSRVTYSETQKDFDAIKINASVLEITVKTGDDYHVSYDCVSYLTPEIQVKDNILVIEQPSLKKLNNSTNNCELTITVPADVTLHNLNVQADVGSIIFHDISSYTATLQADVGNIEADSCSFNNTNAEANVGAVNFRNCTLTEGEITADVGAISLNNCSFTDLDISGELGDITVTTSDNLSDFHMELSVELGSLNVNGNSYKKNFSQQGFGTKNLEIENELGNIELNYTE